LNPVTFFLLALKASLFSTGGLGNVPSLHADLLSRGWATERSFAESLAVGQVSPGPNGLWVVSLGYLLGGVWGTLAAVVAICMPPFFILAVERLYRRVQHHPAVEGFVRGLSLCVVGVFVVVLWGLMKGNVVDLRSVLITVASLGLGATRRVPVVVIIGLAALVGMALR
jgi:chromate transporter